MEKFDRRRKYYMILDCETATLPFTSEYNSAEDKKKIAIAKPLIYDIGYQIIDINGNIYKRVNYLISETFFDMQIFSTAYYAAKRSIYLERLEHGEITLARWDTFAEEFENDLKVVTATGAYNSMLILKRKIVSVFFAVRIIIIVALNLIFLLSAILIILCLMFGVLLAPIY